MSMADRDGVIWYDGELVQWRDATTHVLTHTLHYGMGVFEGVRAYDTPQGTAIFRLQAHTDRLFDSAHIMNMQIPYSRDEINEATRAAVRENNLESAYIRPMVFYGSEGMGQAHTDRLFDSAHIMNMQIPYSRDEINEATRAAVRENNLESAYIRPMVFYGSEGMG
ncbi:aminotransferase class IV, partial [Pseudomonas aeruginosa]|uniref:aminotransferase class IV n=1 Tax=Pseudomonas aeruginosa TaxID=287 RepID=UPI001A9E87CF